MTVFIAHAQRGSFSTRELPKIELHDLQQIVGGHIECCSYLHPILRQNGIEMLVNEEGLLKLLPINENIDHFFYVGDVAFVGVRGTELVGLTEDQLEIVRVFAGDVEEDL